MLRLTGLWKSFYSRRFYWEVVQQWRGLGFGFLALLAGLRALLVFFLLVQPALQEFARSGMHELIRQVPPIRIQDGQARAKAHMPYQIVWRDQPVVVIDTTITPDTEQTPKWMREYGVRALLTRDTLILRTGAHDRLHHIDLSDVKMELVITREKLGALADRFADSPWMPGLALLVIAAIFLPLLLVYMLSALLYALPGLLIARLVQVELGYALLVRIAAASMAPALLLDAALVFGLGLSLPLLIGAFITLGYMTFCIRKTV